MLYIIRHTSWFVYLCHPPPCVCLMASLTVLIGDFLVCVCDCERVCVCKMWFFFFSLSSFLFDYGLVLAHNCKYSGTSVESMQIQKPLHPPPPPPPLTLKIVLETFKKVFLFTKDMFCLHNASSTVNRVVCWAGSIVVFVVYQIDFHFLHILYHAQWCTFQTRRVFYILSQSRFSFT